MKNAIVFGATSGIGKELTKVLVANNYKVAITGRRLEKLQELQEKFPNKIIIKKNDIQQLNDLEKVFNEIVTEMKTIDLIVQSSGVGFVNKRLDFDKENETMQTNVIGVTKLYDLAFHLFTKQQFGHLVGVSSIASLRGNKDAPAYFASKAYQKSYLEGLYFKTKTIKSQKVFVTDIRPGFVDTAMALGANVFWMVPVEKAVKQIYSAIKKKKRKAYISKRWTLIALVYKLMPSWLLKKVL